MKAVKGLPSCARQWCALVPDVDVTYLNRTVKMTLKAKHSLTRSFHRSCPPRRLLSTSSLPISVQRARFQDASTVLLATLSAHYEGATSMVKAVRIGGGHTSRHAVAFLLLLCKLIILDATRHALPLARPRASLFICT